jgi:hypothetical protein
MTANRLGASFTKAWMEVPLRLAHFGEEGHEKHVLLAAASLRRLCEQAEGPRVTLEEEAAVLLAALVAEPVANPAPEGAGSEREIENPAASQASRIVRHERA